MQSRVRIGKYPEGRRQHEIPENQAEKERRREETRHQLSCGKSWCFEPLSIVPASRRFCRISGNAALYVHLPKHPSLYHTYSTYVDAGRHRYQFKVMLLATSVDHQRRKVTQYHNRQRVGVSPQSRGLAYYIPKHPVSQLQWRWGTDVDLYPGPDGVPRCALVVIAAGVTKRQVKQ